MIVFIIIPVLLFSVYTVLRINRPSEQQKRDRAMRDGSAIYFSNQKEKWHKEQGHRRVEPNLFDLKFGTYYTKWYDEQGNDVTYKNR